MVMLCALSCLFIPAASMAKQDISARETFVKSAFSQTVPKARALWLDKKQKKAAKKILRHPYGALRVRYWQGSSKTVWILEEVGKYKPITVGVIIKDGKIEKLSVLTYRESHGWEVKHDFFTRQFIGAHLEKKNALSEKIDGISGATLSVRALKKIARLSLYFDAQIQ